MSFSIGYVIIGITIALIGIIVVLTLISSRQEKGPVHVHSNSEAGGEKAMVIPPSHNELLTGPVTLTINPGTRSTLISYLVLSLTEDPNIQMVSKDGKAARGSLIKLFIKNPVPLFKVLYQIPVVQEVTRKGLDIHVVTI